MTIACEILCVVERIRFKEEEVLNHNVQEFLNLNFKSKLDQEGPGKDPFSFHRSIPWPIFSLGAYGQEILCMTFKAMNFFVSFFDEDSFRYII